MTPIGGYYELELTRGGSQYHTTPYTFKSGRSSLHYILRATNPAQVYIPYYTCNGLLESFEAAQINYRFYEINHLLEPDALPQLGDNEYFLYINYFDIKRQFSLFLSEQYGDKLIVDCSQAFFMKGNGRSWFFNSCRKYFGVPDGSFLYAPDGTQLPVQQQRNEQYLVTHLIARFNGHAQEGYPAFLENEALLGPEITGMSKLSEYLLSHIDYEQVMDKRYRNYDYLDKFFREQHLCPPEPLDNCVPMVYPALLNKPADRQRLNGHQVFIPTYWADIRERKTAGFGMEKFITEHLLPLPIDHRYNLADMEKMVKLIKPLS